ncbi:MAG: hypothetical protein QGG73_04045 [Candidatus Hydrogenedentes bacterium]|nr:hypothetical protein [Candidatus Hydrogenedentota bacterium]
MDDKTTSERTVTINGEEVLVDAVKDPRMGRMGQWHTRGVYKSEYVMAKGDNLEAAFENWREKAKAM